MFTQKNADKLTGWLGWWLAATLAVSFSFQAGALDFDKELRRQEYMTTKMIDAPDRSGATTTAKAKSTSDLDADNLEDDYKVELIPVKRDKSS